jgi:hypothetical protein
MTLSVDIVRRQARAARGELENTLDAHGWPWSVGLSRWADMLLMLEEQSS